MSLRGFHANRSAAVDRADFYPDSFWRSLKQLNAFRLFLAVYFIITALFAERLPLFGHSHGGLTLAAGLVYAALALWFRHSLQARSPAFAAQLLRQLLTDILAVSFLMHYGGGNETGLGLLLTVPMAAAGLHPQTRVTLGLAAMASIAVLLEQVFYAYGSGFTDGYLRAAMLAVGFFTIAAISHVLAKGALSAARIAGEKTREAEDLERISGKVIQDLPYGVLVLDREGRVLLFNAQAEALIGAPVRVQAGLGECLPELAGPWHDWLGGAGSTPCLFETAEKRRLRARLLELGPGRSEGAMVVVEDMSELEQEATHMKLAALGRLTANLAHEIRNPLSAINHAAQLLKEDSRDDPGMGRLTRIIEDNVGRLNYLVEDVLSLSRRDRQNRENIKLDAFLVEFVAHFEQAESVPDGVIQSEVGPGLEIVFDRLHLHQILWNLCRNAFRHCSRGPGSIQLRAVLVGDMAHIEIYNDGPSIPAEMRQRLFEPFYSTASMGTGLGLHIALELAQANDGQLRCLEQAKGARFRLIARLPKP